MKLQQRNSGEWEAVLKTGRRGALKTVRLHVTEKPQAEKLVVELDLERVERMSVAGTISRDLVRQITNSEKVMVATAIDRWYAWLKSTSESGNTAGNYHLYALAWMRDSHSRPHDIGEIVEDDIDRWVNQQDGCKANTRRFRLAVMRSLFWFCKEKNYRDDDPSAMVSVRYKDLPHELKEPRAKRLFTDEEYNKLFSWIKNEIGYMENAKFWLAAVAIGRRTALRLGDVASLEWSSFKTGRLIVHTDKKNTRVDQEIDDDLRAALNLIPKNNSRWCFPKQAALNSDANSRAQLPTQFGRILKRAGIESHHYHELRASKLTEMSNSGTPISQIAEFAGHTSTKTTEGYIQ